MLEWCVGGRKPTVPLVLGGRVFLRIIRIIPADVCMHSGPEIEMSRKLRSACIKLQFLIPQ